MHVCLGAGLGTTPSLGTGAFVDAGLTPGPGGSGAHIFAAPLPATTPPAASQSQIVASLPFFYKTGCTQNLDLSCVLVPVPWVGYAAMRWAQTAAVGTVPNAAMPNVLMATADDLGEPETPPGGPHMRDKQDVGRRLALAFRDQFIRGDGPFYTRYGMVWYTKCVGTVHNFDSNDAAFGRGHGYVWQPLAGQRAASARRVRTGAGGWVAVGAGAGYVWTNATSAHVDGAVLHIGLPATLQHGPATLHHAALQVRQVRYLWSDNACMGWNSTTATDRNTRGRPTIPLYTAGVCLSCRFFSTSRTE